VQTLVDIHEVNYPTRIIAQLCLALDQSY
jgi:hypothetical protein